MTARKSTGKRLRFEIFKRDQFTCQYCGKQPPEIVLVIDHIKPVSDGGDNDPLNLITACEICNQGKSDKSLTSISPKPDADLAWLETQQEIAELRRYQLLRDEKQMILDEIIENLQHVWGCYFRENYAPDKVMFGTWMTWADPDLIEEAIKITASKSWITSYTNRVKYTLGVLHNMVGADKEAE